MNRAENEDKKYISTYPRSFHSSDVCLRRLKRLQKSKKLLQSKDFCFVLQILAMLICERLVLSTHLIHVCLPFKLIRNYWLDWLKNSLKQANAMQNIS